MKGYQQREGEGLPSRRGGGVKGYLGLFCKAFSLNYWVVELSVSIADLPLVHKQLKPLCHAWLLSMPDNTHTHI